MSSYTDLLKVMKKAALDAVESSKPVAVCFGKVTNTNKTKIIVDQKIVLKKAQLIFTKTLKESDLKKGDELLLLRMQGGQKYVVLERMDDE